MVIANTSELYISVTDAVYTSKEGVKKLVSGLKVKFEHKEKLVLHIVSVDKEKVLYYFEKELLPGKEDPYILQVFYGNQKDFIEKVIGKESNGKVIQVLQLKQTLKV